MGIKSSLSMEMGASGRETFLQNIAVARFAGGVTRAFY